MHGPVEPVEAPGLVVLPQVLEAVEFSGANSESDVGAEEIGTGENFEAEGGDLGFGEGD